MIMFRALHLMWMGLFDILWDSTMSKHERVAIQEATLLCVLCDRERHGNTPYCMRHG
jgi:hypothetical protein